MGEWKGIGQLARMMFYTQPATVPDFESELRRAVEPLLKAAEARLRADTIETSERLRKAVERWK